MNKSHVAISLKKSIIALEIFGIMMGDGCLSKYYANFDKCYRRDMVITGNLKKDSQYLYSYVKPLIEQTFNARCTVVIRQKDTVLNLVIRNRGVFEWFVRNGFPIGKKGEQLKIPQHLYGLSKNKINNLIRGIFDTDGFITARKDEGYKYPYIIITSISKTLREQLKSLLRIQGLHAYIHDTNVVVRGNKNFEKWFKLIGSKNQRNLNKYQEWLKTGRIYCGPIVQPGN